MPPHDLHARVAATILAQLETADPMPRNARTSRRYRGINVLALWCVAQASGYADARWATYRQWAALGAQARKAECGTLGSELDQHQKAMTAASATAEA